MAWRGARVPRSAEAAPVLPITLLCVVKQTTKLLKPISPRRSCRDGSVFALRKCIDFGRKRLILRVLWRFNLIAKTDTITLSPN
jgi:hypothetical protein